MRTIKEMIEDVDKECCKSYAASIGGIEYIKKLPVWTELTSESYHHELKAYLQQFEGQALNHQATIFQNELRRIVKQRES